MSIRFCDSCGNMLTPNLKHDKKLIFHCEICSKDSKEKENNEFNNLVYRNEIRNEQTSIKTDAYITNDPTYARSFNLTCKKCGCNESICFQNPNINDPGMKLIYLCCNKNYNGTGEPCNNRWFKMGITFVIIPRNWNNQNTEKKPPEINIYGFDNDSISDMIKAFNEKLRSDKEKQNLLPITKYFYDKEEELDPNDKNIWRDIYKKDSKVYAFSENELEDKN